MCRNVFLLTMLCLGAMIYSEPSPAEMNPVEKYAFFVEAKWAAASPICKSAAGVDMSICRDMFVSDGTSDDTEIVLSDYWPAARKAAAEILGTVHVIEF